MRQRALRTWYSLRNFFENEAGTTLPADRISYSEEQITIFPRTKPTNIGLGMLALLGAERLGTLNEVETDAKLAHMLESLRKADRYEGFFYDWYDSLSVQKLSQWPTDGHDLDQFLSSVDNAWLALALLIVSKAKPLLAESIRENFLDAMDFEFFFDKELEEVWGGYSVSKKEYVNYHYPRNLVSEPRIVHWVNAALCFDKDRKIEILRRLLDKEGQVPSQPAGGSLFELYMPRLFVKEKHLSRVFDQIFAQHQSYGEANLGGLVGLSVVDDPNNENRYTEMGCGGAYPSTSVLSAHGAALAFMANPEIAYRSLTEMEKISGFFDEHGYAEAVDVKTGKVAKETQVFINQVMTMLSLMCDDEYFPELFAKFFDGEDEAALL